MTPFESKGVVSQKSAAIQVFEHMEVGDWVSADDLAYRISEITSAACANSYGPGYQASQHLAGQQAGAWTYYRGGWKRLHPDEQYANVKQRGVRHRRGQRRLVKWVENGLANPAITGPDRHDLEVEHRTQLAQRELDERRQARRRPLPPGSATD